MRANGRAPAERIERFNTTLFLCKSTVCYTNPLRPALSKALWPCDSREACFRTPVGSTVCRRRLCLPQRHPHLCLHLPSWRSSPSPVRGHGGGCCVHSFISRNVSSVQNVPSACCPWQPSGKKSPPGPPWSVAEPAQPGEHPPPCCPATTATFAGVGQGERQPVETACEQEAQKPSRGAGGCRAGPGRRARSPPGRGAQPWGNAVEDQGQPSIPFQGRRLRGRGLDGGG